MNRPADNLACLFSQEPMALKKRLFEAVEPVQEVLFTLSVMVQMDFDIRDACLRHFRQALKQVRAIFLFWIEKAVARWVPNRIAMATRDRRPLPTPRRSAPAGDGR